jgi:phosphoglycerate dehydrogenase-like enzyme
MWRTAEIEEALRAGDQLRWVSYHGVGVDSFPLDLFRESWLQLTSGRGLHATPIAEYVVMAVLAAAKGLPALLQAQARAEWLTRPPAARDLTGSSALVIGYGQIGQAVASRLRAFDVNVTGVRRHGFAGDPDVIGPDAWRARLVDFDWIVLSAPLTDQTRHLIGQTELAAMRPGAWIFNVARGSIIDHAALEAALRGQQIGGAYLDLTDREPLPGASRSGRCRMSSSRRTRPAPHRADGSGRLSSFLTT